MNALIELKRLTTLFKYVSDSTKVIDSIFRDHKIRFTQPAVMNDPIEFNPAVRFDSEDDNFKRYNCLGIPMPSIHDWYQLNLIESRINNYGMLSLTDNPFSFEMWCHYANGHRGFLLEFDITDKTTRPTLELSKGVKLRAYKVRYVNDYFVNIDKLDKGKGLIPFYKIRDAIFLRKTKHWKYEREYRIVRQLADSDTYRPPARRTSYRNKKIYLFPLSLNCISNVIFGVNTPQKIKRKIIESCKNTRINFLQTIIYKDLHNMIDFIPIDRFGSIDEYLKKLPQIFTYDSIMSKYNGQYITVNSSQELPYYHLQPKDFDKYYKKKVKKQTQLKIPKHD